MEMFCGVFVCRLPLAIFPMRAFAEAPPVPELERIPLLQPLVMPTVRAEPG
jgi:hypothetical protein